MQSSPVRVTEGHGGDTLFLAMRSPIWLPTDQACGREPVPSPPASDTHLGNGPDAHQRHRRKPSSVGLGLQDTLSIDEAPARPGDPGPGLGVGVGSQAEGEQS